MPVNGLIPRSVIVKNKISILLKNFLISIVATAAITAQAGSGLITASNCLNLSCGYGFSVTFVPVVDLYGFGIVRMPIVWPVPLFG